jgi:hypothetical protein
LYQFVPYALKVADVFVVNVTAAGLPGRIAVPVVGVTVVDPEAPLTTLIVTPSTPEGTARVVLNPAPDTYAIPEVVDSVPAAVTAVRLGRNPLDFHVPGDPPVTQTQEAGLPTEGEEFSTISNWLNVPLVGTAVSAIA